MGHRKHVIVHGRLFLWLVVIYGVAITSLLLAILGTLLWYGILTIAQWVP